MNLLALLLGAIAVFNPFVGLIMTMIYCRFSMRSIHKSPLQIMALFFVFPIAFVLLLQRQPGVIVAASDAVWGVGFSVLLFLFSLRGRFSFTASMTHSAMLIIIYGVIRQFIFGSYLLLANEQAIVDLGKLFPQMLQTSQMQQSISLMRYMIPSSWMVPQLVALFLGLIVFLRMSGIGLAWKELSFPKYYNFLILATLPLYFFPPLRMVFINSLIALCVLPLIQGIGVILHQASRFSSNLFVMALIAVLITFNLILVALLGFADIWLDFRKLNTKGIYA